MTTISYSGGSGTGNIPVEESFALIKQNIEDSAREVESFANDMHRYISQMTVSPYIKPEFLSISLTNWADPTPLDSKFKPDYPPEMQPIGWTDPADFTVMEPYIPAIEIPTFTESAPSFSTPSEPKPFSGIAPEAPNIEEVQLPSDPEFDLPDPPKLPELQLPEDLILSLPKFDVPMPELPDIVPPQIPTFETPEAYESFLLSALRDKLYKNITVGGTGLPSEVERAIFDRETERSVQVRDEAVNAMLATWAARGFKLPAGVVVAATQDILQKWSWQRLDTSRQIAVEQAKLEQENIRTSLQISQQVEGMLIAHFEKLAELTFRAQEAQLNAALSILKSQIEIHNFSLEKHKVALATYAENLKADLAQLEVYKTRIEKARLSAEVRKQYIDEYLGLLHGTELNIEIYKALLDSTRIKFENQRAKLEVFKGNLELFTTQLRAKQLEFELYKAQLEGRQAPIKVYAERVKAYEALVSAKRVAVEAHTAKANAVFQRNESYIRQYEARLRAKQTEAQVKLEANKTALAVSDWYLRDYQLKLDTFFKKLQYELERARIIQTTNEQNIRQAMDVAKWNLEALVKVASVAIEAASKGSQFMAALGSAGMQAFHMGMSQAYSNSYSFAHSVSQSSVEQHIYEH